MTHQHPGGDTGEAGPVGARVGISEALARLVDEFPDVTVSKVRYLEAQGLINPERSESGYRRFSDADMSLLTWILRQQRQNFLPLKVIHELLEESGGKPPTGIDEVAPFREQATMPVAGSVSITLEEVAAAAGEPMETVLQLEAMGLIEGSEAGSTTVYDGDALLVARLAGICVRNGLDVRHLRMHLVAAQREAGVLEQILLPRLRANDQTAVAAARKRFEELVDAGGQIRDVMRRRSMGRLGHLTH